MARRRSAQSRGSVLGALASLLVLMGIGFSVGIVAGILWEEPRLVLAHLTGHTTEIAWARGTGVAAPPQLAAGEAAAVPPAKEQPAEPAAELPPVAAAPPGRLAVQVGAFGDSAGAERLAARLRSKGYLVYVTPGVQQEAPRWRVRVGPFPDREKAERVAARLKHEEQLPTWVLDEDGG
jgi:cell division septation protein DedD